LSLGVRARRCGRAASNPARPNGAACRVADALGYASGMECRAATRADLDAVVDMMRRQADLHADLDPARYGMNETAYESYRRWLTKRVDDERSVLLVADRGGVCVAFLIGTIEPALPLYRVTEFGFIHDIWVEPAYRNEGVGRQLVSLAVERFAGLGVKQIRLETVEPNDGARQLFERCGFRVCVREMLMELP
jgi:ribosomal protein S18 acetylase RimI-like enzyme